MKQPYGDEDTTEIEHSIKHPKKDAEQSLIIIYHYLRILPSSILTWGFLMLLQIETCHGCPRLFLVAQYYAALKYAAESTRLLGRNRTRRRVYLMPLGGADGGWV